MSAIHDVAKLAGVAPITVSRVVNNNGYVSEETRRRVEAAIQELAYIPNALGPSLRSKRTQTLALVLSDITNPFWTAVARGVEDAANLKGYHIIIGNTDESPEKEEQYLTFLMKKQADGFLVVPVSSHSQTTLQRHRVPFVMLDRKISDDQIDSVRCDSVSGAYKLTKHLLELGHRNIAIITGRKDISTAYERVAGALLAFEESGISDRPQTYWGDYVQETGYKYAKQVLDAKPRPTAIFATNNFLAIGAMRALREAGVQVPKDMSVVVFDDLPSAITIDPFFTVAAQPAYEMGKQAAELLLTRLAKEGPEGQREIVLPVEIIVRKSSGKPAASALAQANLEDAPE
ncbi:MAG: substrate-binding domain-containing protein [Chloroflexi bacterium]|nr:substrate-binding domain-containing protein [Chloroflexota bacterium]